MKLDQILEKVQTMTPQLDSCGTIGIMQQQRRRFFKPTGVFLKGSIAVVWDHFLRIDAERVQPLQCIAALVTRVCDIIGKRAIVSRMYVAGVKNLVGGSVY